MKKRTKILIALIVGLALAMLLMGIAIYFGFTNVYSTEVNMLTVKMLGMPIYELTKAGTEYVGNPIGIYMGAVCGICMALSLLYLDCNIHYVHKLFACMILHKHLAKGIIIE